MNRDRPDPIARAAALACWSGPVDPQPLSGGITNANFVVEDRGQRFVVRIGDDIPVHGILRFNELAASRAAFAAGVSPEPVYAEPGALVLRFIDGATLTPEMVRPRAMLVRILALLRRCHHDIPNYLRGPVLAFWVFHVIRDYGWTLKDAGSARLPTMARLLAISAELERAVGAIDVVFGHNDLLAANFIDDGRRLWLFDWDYGGFNSPLFDLGNLSSNNAVTPEDEAWLLEAYCERPASDSLRRSYAAMKCASLLRETTWSMVQEIHSTLDFDYAAYTDDYLARFERSWVEFQQH